ncbi:MAG TPA: serpin family protein, partial [Elusimicrobiota bacterium]|nr:serpin family protein [Elusimicrobiota bacterium]
GRPARGADAGTLAGAQNAFGIELFQTIYGKSSGANLFLSPASAQTALAMLYNGAQGTTRQAMARALCFGALSDPQVNDQMAEFRKSLSAQTGVRLDIADSLWGNRRVRFKDDFLKINRLYYDAAVESLDFSNPASLGRINRWCDRQTRGKIPVILDELRPDDALVLLNAIYFKGLWETPFQKELTSPGDFHAAGGVRQAPLMSRTGTFSYAQTNDYQAVALPYRGGALRMLLFLPAQGPSAAGALDSFVAALSSATIASAAAAMQPAKIELGVPRFRMENAADLVPALTAMGMGIAFDPAAADFGALADRGHGPAFFVGRALQKAFVDVSEEGTEAAAATVVTVSASAAMEPPPVRVDFDRPFLFMIQDQATGAVLFIGCVQDPTQPLGR